MRRMFFYTVALLGLAGIAETQQSVVEVRSSSCTIRAINITANTAINVSTAVAGGIGELDDRTVLEVCNNDGTVILFCGFDASVSTRTTSADLGRRINTISCEKFAIGEDIDLFCMPQAGAFLYTSLLQCR